MIFYACFYNDDALLYYYYYYSCRSPSPLPFKRQIRKNTFFSISPFVFILLTHLCFFYYIRFLHLLNIYIPKTLCFKTRALQGGNFFFGQLLFYKEDTRKGECFGMIVYSCGCSPKPNPIFSHKFKFLFLFLFFFFLEVQTMPLCLILFVAHNTF